MKSTGAHAYNSQRQIRDIELYRRLFRQARPYRFHLLLILSLALLAAPIALLTPFPLKIAVDSVLRSGPLPGFVDAFIPGSVHSDATLIVAVAVLVLVVALLTQVQIAVTWWLQAYVGEKLVLQFQSELFNHVQRLSLMFHDARGTADSLFRIQWDAIEIQNIAIAGLIPLIAGVVTIIAMVVVTATIDLQLAMIALVVSPVLFLMLAAYKRRTRSEWKQAKQLQSSAISVVQETLSALRVVKAFGQEERQGRRFVEFSRASVKAKLRLVLAESTFGLMIGMTLAAGSAALLFVGLNHVQAGVITLGELLLVMGYLTQLYGPLQGVSQKVAGLQASLASAERAFSLLDEFPEVSQRSSARPLERAKGAIAFRDVSFGYDPKHAVLQDVNFEVPPGASVGVAGPTGAGKTTLVNLLTRSFDPNGGSLRLDGLDLRDYKLSDLRNQFAIVLQEPVLFSATIAENIAYARPEASLEEIAAAALSANAHDFILKLPKGYDTQVGERGMRLSGGERQRISLARAFLKDAPILILDEPTSAVDTATEELILEAMSRLMSGRTTFVIAHRLSTLNQCDLLLYVDGGRVIPIPRHGEARAEEILANRFGRVLLLEGPREGIGA